MIKPSNTSANLHFGRGNALDGDIAAIGTRSNFQLVFVYNITSNPAEELAILTSPDSTGDDKFGSDGVIAVNRAYGVIVGAYHHNIGGIR